MANNNRNFIEISYPEQSFNIWNKFKKSNFLEKHFNKNNKLYYEVEELKERHMNVFLASKNASNNRLKRIILALIPEYYSYESIMVFFKTTHWQIQQARELHSALDIGTYLVENTYFRNKLDTVKVRVFLEFICKENYLQDVAYGDKLLKINNDVSISIPFNIRLNIHKNIIVDYHSMCKEENLNPLSQSTCYKILNECVASFSKCLQGLDVLLADGLEAFESIDALLDVMKMHKIDQQELNTLKSMIQSSKLYLQHRFKKKLDFFSECSDHCANLALTHAKENNSEIIK